MRNWLWDKNQKDFTSLITKILRWRDQNILRMKLWKWDSFDYPVNRPKIRVNKKPPDRQIGWWVVRYSNEEKHLYWNGLYFEHNVFYFYPYGWMYDSYEIDERGMELTVPEQFWDKDEKKWFDVKSEAVWDEQNQKWTVDWIYQGGPQYKTRRYRWQDPQDIEYKIVWDDFFKKWIRRYV